MTEALKGKESLSEKEAVREDTRLGLKTLKKDVEKADQERKKTEKNVLACIIYLELTDLKKSYEEIMEKDSQTTIKSVQYLLKNLGYDVGEVDGILVTKGKKTSKTMEAIKKFQRDNGLKLVDGLPGGKTIKKLLERYYSIINSRSELGLKANGLTTLTNKEAESLSKIRKLILNRVTSITDEQAEILSKVSILELNGLKSLTDAQAKSLSKVQNLKLKGLTSITDKQLELLLNGKCKYVAIPLEILTDNQLKYLVENNILTKEKLGTSMDNLTYKEAEPILRKFLNLLVKAKFIAQKESEKEMKKIEKKFRDGKIGRGI